MKTLDFKKKVMRFYWDLPSIDPSFTVNSSLADEIQQTLAAKIAKEFENDMIKSIMDDDDDKQAS